MVGWASSVVPGYPGAQTTSVRASAAAPVAACVEAEASAAAAAAEAAEGVETSRLIAASRTITNGRTRAANAEAILGRRPTGAADPHYRDNQQFQRLFPEREQVVLLAEAPDPFAPAVLVRFEAIEKRLAALPRVHPYSALTLFGRVRPGAVASASPGEFRRFATGT